MPKYTPETAFLKDVPHPAFLVSAGIVRSSNRDAKRLNIKRGMSIDEIIHIGATEYHQFKRGRLCLTLILNNVQYNASVIKYRSKDLFFIESEFLNPELFMLAETVKPLKEPLSCALNSVEMLQSNPDIRQNPALGTLNRNLYRLYKVISDMSDAATYCRPRESKMENCDIVAVISEMMKKTAIMLHDNKQSLKFICNIEDGFYGCIDKEKIERAILNIIVEAVLFSKERKTVKITLSKEKRYLRLSFLFRVQETELDFVDNTLFSCTNDPDGLDVKNGCLNNLIITRNAISAHNGTLHFDWPRKGSLGITISVPVKDSNGLNLHSSFVRPSDYIGGFDHQLIELSEILPDEFYK